MCPSFAREHKFQILSSKEDKLLSKTYSAFHTWTTRKFSLVYMPLITIMTRHLEYNKDAALSVFTQCAHERSFVFFWIIKSWSLPEVGCSTRWTTGLLGRQSHICSCILILNLFSYSCRSFTFHFKISAWLSERSYIYVAIEWKLYLLALKKHTVPYCEVPCSVLTNPLPCCLYYNISM